MGGVLGNAFFDESGGVGFGVLYSNLTLGTRERNGTFGVGYGYVRGEWSKSPIINMGFMSRIRRKTVFISENYLIGSGEDSAVVLSAGVRFLGKKLAIDGALFTLLTGAGVFEPIAWPWLSIHVPFGANETGSKAKK